MYTQEVLSKKESDMSKNLVTGEIEYRPKKKQGCMIALVVAVGALALSLAVLTVVREMQISRLRSEVDQLTVNMIAVTANIKSLNQKVNRDLNDFKTLDDDTIYADGEESPVSKDSAMGKLKDVTVLEDETDDMDDDEDYEDEESGYWYEDYDRRPKNGRTNMVHLKQEELLGSVVTQGQKRASDHPSNIHQIHRMLNGLDSQVTGAPKESDESAVRDKRSVFPDSNANDAVITKPEDSPRRKMKKYSSSDSPKMFNFQHTVSRTVRNSDDEGRRPFVAAHFHGNTSHLNPEVHEHYKGNGLIRVAHDAPHNVWYPAPWTMSSPHPRPTLTNKGHVHVRDTGVYLVYVQIYYLDTHDIISWVLHRTNAEIEGRETLLQCAQSSHSSEPLEKPNSCFSAAALFLKAGDRLAVRNTGGDRHSLMEPEKSFIGLIKLADANDPNEEL